MWQEARRETEEGVSRPCIRINPTAAHPHRTRRPGNRLDACWARSLCGAWVQQLLCRARRWSDGCVQWLAGGRT